MDRKIVDKCLKNFEWEPLEAHLKTLTDDFNPSDLIEHIATHDRMMEKFETPNLTARRQARASLMENMAAYFETTCNPKCGEALRELDELFIVIENGYHQIWSARLNGPSGELTPEQRVSGAFQTAADTICELDKLSTAFLEKQTHFGNGNVFTGPDGEPVNADASIEIVCEVVSSTLQAEGRAYQWTVKSGSPLRKGTVVVPKLPSLKSKDLTASRYSAYNALFWRNWRVLEQQKRFLGGHLEHFTLDKAAAAGQYPDQWEYFPAEKPLITADRVANERWKRQLLQTFLEMTAKFGISEQVTGLGQNVALPPDDILSEAELLTIEAFFDTLSRDISKETIEYSGLTLIEWIRGFAILKAYIGDRFDADDSQSLLPVRSREEWKTLLQHHGLPDTKSDILICHLTFNKDSRDIYDCPFIAMSDGELCLFGPSVRSSEIYTILNSILNKLEADFSEKGKAFEARILDKLNSFDGVEAKPFETKRDGEQYQFDVLMRFDNQIFLIELKNRSLSYGVPQRVFRHMQRTMSDVRQTKRLDAALEAYPDILDGLFGAGASSLPRHACLTYSKPYAIPGGIEGVYVYDTLALIRFFENQHLSITSARKVGPKRLLHAHHVADIWGQDKPTAPVLLREMNDPFQVGTLTMLLKTTPVVGEFDTKHAFIRHEITFEPQTGRSTCDYFESDYDEIMKGIFKADADIDVIIDKFPNLKPKPKP